MSANDRQVGEKTFRLNQCDGCRIGAPVVEGLHKDENGRSFMTCERDLYEAPVRDAGPTPYQGRTTRRD